MGKQFPAFSLIDCNQIQFNLGSDRMGKPQLVMVNAATSTEVAMLTPPMITQWPRCSGDGNFGTMFGPTDISKAKYTLDLTDGTIGQKPNLEFEAFGALLSGVDDKLLDFVTENQLKIIGRKNLTRDEVKMLQIRSVRPKYDKLSGVLVGHSVNLSTPKFAWDGMGGKMERVITVCDFQGKAVPHGAVCPGDCVSATMYAAQVYTGVGGDKFGIQWGFQDVSVVCQRIHLEQKEEVTAFQTQSYDFGSPYQTFPDLSVNVQAAA